MDKPRSPPLSTWLSPEGIVVVAAAVATAALASLPVVLVPGALAYGILTYLRVARFRALDRPTLGRAYAARVERCARLERQILRAIEGAGAEHRAMLSSSADRVRGLARSARDLARRLQALEERLGAEDPKSAAEEASALERRAAEAHDPAAQKSYARALEQHRQRAGLIRELRARRERGDAELTRIELTLEAVSAQILRIESAEASDATAEGARVAESLDALSIEVEAAAEAVDMR